MVTLCIYFLVFNKKSDTVEIIDGGVLVNCLAEQAIFNCEKSEVVRDENV